MDTGRLRRIVLLLLATGAAWAQDVRILVQDSPLAGLRYYAAADVWRELRVGDRLELAREHTHPHYANAVAVLWRGHKLGYVPRRDNAAVAWGLERGAPLRARISVLTHHANPARRVRFEVYVE